MPLDPRAKRFLDMLRATGQSQGATEIAERRESFALLMRTAGAPPLAIERRNLTVAGAAGPLSARLYSPANARDDPLPGLVFFHGGGFVSGDLETHDALCSRLAAAAGCRLLSVDYRLAPEHPFPAAVEDACNAAAAVFARPADLGMDRSRIGVGGDSVGANLAVSACRALVKGGVAPRLQVLICPVLDATRQGESHRLFESGHFLDAAALEGDLQAYGGGEALDRTDPRLSPLGAPVLTSLPPALIETAECDPVRDDGAAYAERLAAAGIAVGYTCHPGMIHLFYGFGKMIPHGAAALSAIGEKVGAALRGDVGKALHHSHRPSS